MRLDYLFWNNLKKQGYNDGQVFKPSYQKLIQENNLKGIDELVNKRTDEILKNQKIQTEKTLSHLDHNIQDIKNDIDKIEKKKNRQQDDIVLNYQQSIQKNNDNYQFYLTSDLEIVKNINGKLKSFYESIEGYTISAKDNIQSNINNLVDYFQNIQYDVIALTDKQANIELKKNMYSYVNLEAKKRINHSKDLIMLGFLLFICIYDIFFGYRVVHGFLLGEDLSSFWLDFWSVFAAFGFVLLVVGLPHFLVKDMENTKSKTQKNINKLMLVIIVVVIIIFIAESNPKVEITQLFNGKENSNRVETIFRTLLIPAMVVGEILISRINRDNIFLFGKKLTQPFRYVTALIAQKIYLLKNQKVKILIKKQEEEINTMLDDISTKLTNNIAFSTILTTVEDIKNLLGPIYEQHESKIAEFEAKKYDIEQRKDQELSAIDNNYNTQKITYEAKITAIENQIRIIKKQLGDAENEVGSGIKLGLTS